MGTYVRTCCKKSSGTVAHQGQGLFSLSEFEKSDRSQLGSMVCKSMYDVTSSDKAKSN